MKLNEISDYICRGFIVAPEDRRSEFKRHIVLMQFRRFREKVGFLSYDELLDFYKETKKFIDIVKKLGLKAILE